VSGQTIEIGHDTIPLSTMRRKRALGCQRGACLKSLVASKRRAVPVTVVGDSVRIKEGRHEFAC
jgi:hypothetical protein